MVLNTSHLAARAPPRAGHRPAGPDPTRRACPTPVALTSCPGPYPDRGTECTAPAGDRTAAAPAGCSRGAGDSRYYEALSLLPAPGVKISDARRSFSVDVGFQNSTISSS